MIKWKFYDARADGAKPTLAHRGIMIVSDPLIHVETQFSDGISWSSELGIGPRFKDIGYTHPLRWGDIEHPWITPEQEATMRYKAELWCELRESGFSKYDLQGAGGCLVTGNENPWDPFCSEGCYEIYPDEHKIACLNSKLHPQKLYEVGLIITRLKEREH